MISPQHVDGLEQRIKELTAQRDELSAQLKTSRRDYEVMNKFREGAEAERDALAAHVARLTELLERAQSERIPDYCELDKAIDAAIDSGPETSLAALKAQWQAEVATRIFCDLEAEFDPCHPIIERVEHIESEYLSQAGGDA